MVWVDSFGMRRKQSVLGIEIYTIGTLERPAHPPVDEESIMLCKILRFSESCKEAFAAGSVMA